MKLIGVGGTNGSGKDTLGEFLADEYGWMFVSVSQILRDELKKEGLPQDRHHTHQLSARWRRENGTGVLIDKAVQKYKASKADYNGLVVSSLRNPGEADEVHRLGGKVVWLDADIKLRYERATSRSHGRVEDKQTFEEFIDDEQHQMNHSGDQATLNMNGVKAKADIFITNDSDDINTFKRSIGKALAGLI